jgi:hypothetical protein
MAAAALKTLHLAIKKGTFLRLRENVAEQAQKRTDAVVGAIAWSVATPGKISMWPTLLRHAQSRDAATAARGLDLTQEAAESLAAFGKSNFNDALLHGLALGASIAKAASTTPSRQRRRPQELSPIAQPPRLARHLGLRPDIGDDDEGDAGAWSGGGGNESYDFRSVTGAALPLPIGSSLTGAQSTSQILQAKKLKHVAPSVPPALAPSSGQYIGALSTKQRKVR